MAGSIGGYDSAAEEARRRAEEEARKRAEEEARKKAEAEAAAKEAQEAAEAQEAEEARETEEAQAARQADSIWLDYQSGNINATEMAQYIDSLADGFEFLTPEQVYSAVDVKAEDPAIEQAQNVLLEQAKALIPGKENWTDEEIVQAVTISYLSNMNQNISQTLNSPDTYGWTGELRNSVVEFFGYADSYEDLTRIINTQQDGMEVLTKAISGELTKDDIYQYSKEKLALDPNFSFVADAVDYLPYDIAVDWAMNGIPENNHICLTTRTSDGFGAYTLGIEQPPYMMTDVIGITIYDENSDVVYQNGNVECQPADFTVDETNTIHYNDTLQAYSPEDKDALVNTDFDTLYQFVQGQEYNPETLVKYLDSSQALEYLAPSLNNITEFTNNILGAETYTDLIDVFNDYYGDEDVALEQLNQYLHDTVNPQRENFMSDQEYQQVMSALASSVEFGFGRSTTDIQVKKNTDGTFSLTRTFADGSQIEDDTDMLSICSSLSGVCNTGFFFKKFDDALRSETGYGIEDYSKAYEESLGELSGLSKQLEGMIENYDKGEKNAVNVVAGVGTTAAVIAALALAPYSGGTSLAMLGTASTGGSALGSSVALATVVGGSTNTLIRGTNAESSGQKYSFGDALADFTSGGVQGALIPLSAGVFKFAYNAAGYSAASALANAQSGSMLASLAQSPFAYSGVKIFAATTAGCTTGNLAGAVGSANNYIFNSDEEFSFEGLLRETAKGANQGGFIGASMAFGSSLLSEAVPLLNYMLNQGTYAGNVDVIPGYNAYILDANGLPIMAEANGSSYSTPALMSGNTGTQLSLPTPNALALNGQNALLPASANQMPFVNTMSGLSASQYLLPQASTIGTADDVLLLPSGDVSLSELTGFSPKQVDALQKAARGAYTKFYEYYDRLLAHGGSEAVQEHLDLSVSFNKKNEVTNVFTKIDGQVVAVDNFEYSPCNYDYQSGLASYSYQVPGGKEVVEYRVQMGNPDEIAFTQGQVQESGFNAIKNGMSKTGWQGMPIDAVRMPNGDLVSIDNRRLLAAREVDNVTQVPMVVHEWNNKLTYPLIDRFNFRLTDTSSGSLYWGEAARDRLYENGLLGDSMIPIKDVPIDTSKTPLVTEDRYRFMQDTWGKEYFPDGKDLDKNNVKPGLIRLWNERIAPYYRLNILEPSEYN